MTAFGDAFFYIALFNRRDGHHARVKAWAAATQANVITTQWVLAEVADAFAETPDRRNFPRLVRNLSSDPRTRIMEASASDFMRGLSLYERRPDKDWSLTDCISFDIMEREGLSDALTRDRHFKQAGFVPLFADE